MEEKERYKWSQDVIVECPYEDYDYIIDTENNVIFDDDNYFKLVDLLNQQDKELSKLRASYQQVKEENSQLKQQLEEKEKEIEGRDKRIDRLEEDYYQETRQLEWVNEQLAEAEKQLAEENEYTQQYRKDCAKIQTDYYKLKKQLHDLPKKIVEEIKANNIYLNSSKPNQKDHIYDSYLIEAKTLNAVLEKYGGEDAIYSEC